MERRVLEDLIAEGLSVREIGDRLGRTHASVRYWMTKHRLVTPRGALWRASRAARDDVASTRRGVCPRHGEVASCAEIRGTGASSAVRRR